MITKEKGKDEIIINENEMETEQENAKKNLVK